MKIISKYKDYYDGVQSLGLDNSTIYKRQTHVIEVPKLNDTENKLDELLGYGKVIKLRPSSKNITRDLYLVDFLIGFCGKIYTCKCALENLHTAKNPELSFFYSKDDLRRFLKSREKEYSMDELKYELIGNWKKRKELYWEDALMEFNSPQEKLSYLFHEIGQPIFLYPSYIFDFDLVEISSWTGSVRRPIEDLIVNPNLKNIGFHKVKDAFQCYQEIEQYLNGVLGNTESTIDERTDVEKIKSHGFDLKYGFRKRKK